MVNLKNPLISKLHMLDFLKKYSISSILIKILLSLLLLSFAFVGFGQLFKGSDYAIKIEEIEYSTAKWNELLNNRLKDFRIKYGVTPDKDTLKLLKQQLADELINNALLYLKAKELGIVLSDEMVQREILKIPAFFDKGKFSEEKFSTILAQIGMSKESFIEQIKQDLTRQTFLYPFISQKLVIPQFSEIIADSVLQKRKVEYISIPYNAIIISKEPSDEDLENIFNNNKQRYETQEEREIRYILISNNNMKNEILVSEKELESLYNDKKFLFITPEKRSVRQIKFESISTAKKAYDELEKGADFLYIAKKYSPNFVDIQLGLVTKNDLSLDVSQEIFSSQSGKITAPIKTPLGVYIFKIDDIFKERLKPFSEVKELLKEQLIKSKTSQLFLEKLNSIKQDLDSNKNINDLSKIHNTVIQKELLTPNSKLEILTDDLKNKIFASPLNKRSDLVSIGNNTFCIFTVDKITPAHIKNIKDVKDHLKELWIQQERGKVFEKVNFDQLFINSQSYKQLISSAHIHKGQVEIAHDKNEKTFNFPTLLNEKLFTSKINSTIWFDNVNEKTFYLAKVKKVTLPDRNALVKFIPLYSQQLNTIEQEEILVNIVSALRKEYTDKIKINID